jgi:SAM-dependent methyltransferase
VTNGTNLKITFDTDAQAYHTYRPHYPAALFEKLIADAHLPTHAELLEIGPGTAQATLPLAQRGYHITAVELGPHLARKAQDELAAYKNITVITGAFEDAVLPVSHFDLVYAATAFHWIKPAYKFTRPFALLKPGGHLAIIHTEHVSDERGDKFFFASRPIYQQYDHNGAAADDDFRLPKISELHPPAIDTALFDLQSFSAFPLAITYSGAAYAGLLGTYSPTIAMPKHERAAFLQEIQELIDTKFNGAATRHFAMTLTIARRK